ncbi:MAG: hypothetical protein ACWA44_10800 [Thiotrichales bacterium]
MRESGHLWRGQWLHLELRLLDAAQIRTLEALPFERRVEALAVKLLNWRGMTCDEGRPLPCASPVKAAVLRQPDLHKAVLHRLIRHSRRALWWAKLSQLWRRR